MGFDLSKTPKAFFDLAKAGAAIATAKGLDGHRTRVVTMMDISGSMDHLYRAGVVRELVRRLMGPALLFDDNQAVDYFAFGVEAHTIGELSAEQFEGGVDRFLGSKRLEGGTNYAAAIKQVVGHFFPSVQLEKKGFWGGAKAADPGIVSDSVPVFVQFVTDGDCNDQYKADATALMQRTSGMPIFWQFLGLGSGPFGYLEKLDNLSGRRIDNANFAKIGDPAKMSDQALYNILMGEYPQWLAAAREHGILTA